MRVFRRICAIFAVAALLISSAAAENGVNTDSYGGTAAEDTAVGNVMNDEMEIIDDCADFSKCETHSENLFAYTVPEEDYYAYGSDYTMFRRSTNTREWVVYKNVGKDLRKIKYPIFNTYFKYTDNIPHFTFETSSDGVNWREVSADKKIDKAEDWKWISVNYSLLNLGDDDNYIKIIYSDKTDVEWTPMLASVTYAYRYDGYGFADCDGTLYESAAAQLCALGFVEGFNKYEFRPYDSLSRAELAQVVARILNVQTGADGERVFTDVAVGHWASGAVGALYYMGIISGDENKRFNPDDTVTYIEAAKILVCALGYTAAAESDGGYPGGYRSAANRLKLFDGLDLSDESTAMNRGDAAVMIQNALAAKAVYNISFGDNAKFKKDGETLLSIYHNIQKTEGVVTEYGAMSIISENACAADGAVIDGIKYSCGNIKIGRGAAYGGLLGRYVTAYTKDNTLIYAEPKGGTVRRISADKYLKTENRRIYYEDENGRERTVALGANTRIVYNGRYKSRVGVSGGISIESGYLELIANNNSTADTILIWDFKNYVAANSAGLKQGVTDRQGGVFNPDFDNAEQVIVTAYGETTDIDDAAVSKGDVICAAISDDGEIMLIKIRNTAVTGRVTYLGKDGDSDRIGTDRGEYTAVLNYKTLGGKIKVGADITAYTDINGQIFAIECGGGYEYAYLCGAADNDAFGGEVKLRMLTAANEVADLTATDRTKLNGASKTVTELATLSPQLLRIKRNSRGEIAEIETAQENIGTIDAAEFSLNFSAQPCKYYSGALCVFASIYQLGEQTPVFIIPSNIKDMDKYRTGNRYSLFSDYEYNVRLYDVSDKYTVGAAVVFMDGSRERSVQSYDNIAYIRDCSVINNSEGEACLKLDVYSNGQESAVYFDNDGGSDDTNGWLSGYAARDTKNGNIAFHGGEVIQQYSDSESYCKSFRMLLTEDMIENNTVYEHNTGDYGAISQNDYYSELYTAYGEVKNRFSDKLIICPNNFGRLRTVTLSGARVYKYNKRQKTLNTASDSDIRTGDYVFVRMSYGDTTDIIVVSNDR